MITRSILLTAIALLGLTSTAAAHIQLVEPTPRVPNDTALKMGPCGGAVWGANGTTTFAPGQQINVKLIETISHDGAFRVAMDMAGDNDFTPMVTKEVLQNFTDYFAGKFPANQLPAEVTTPVQEGNMFVLRNFFGLHRGGDCPSGMMETVKGQQGCVWSIPVTLPNETCENCTLQVIQMMSDHVYPNVFYHHCADIKLEGQPSNNAGGAGNTGGTTTSSGGAATGSSTGGVSSSSAGGAVSASGGKSTGGGANTSLPGTGGAAPTGSGSPQGTAQGAAADKKSGCGISGGSSRPSEATWLVSLGLGALLVRRTRSKKFGR